MTVCKKNFKMKEVIDENNKCGWNYKMKKYVK